VNLFTIEETKEKFLLASSVAVSIASKEVRTPIIDIRIVVTRMVIRHHTNIPTWVKLLVRARITNPNSIHHRKGDPSRPPLRIMIADVTFVTIQITYLMLAHKKARISNMLRAS
jgi:hypothetical protein